MTLRLKNSIQYALAVMTGILMGGMVISTITINPAAVSIFTVFALICLGSIGALED